MKWIDASKYWPAMDTRNIIVNGRTLLELKSEYNMPGHEECPIGVDVKFYCLIESPQPWSGDFDNIFSIERALIYDINDFCCTSEEDREEHRKYLRKIGCYWINIRDFIKDTNELTACWDSINQWAYLEDNE